MTESRRALERDLFAAAGLADDPTVGAALEDAEEHVRLIEKLIAARDARKMRQKDVAKRMRTTQSRVSNIERLGGDPRLSTVMRYGRAVGLRVRFVVVAADDVPCGWEQAGSITIGAARTPEKVAAGDGWESQTPVSVGA